jgi:hypothetical protein
MFYCPSAAAAYSDLLNLISKAAQAQPATAAPAASGALHNMAIRKGD